MLIIIKWIDGISTKIGLITGYIIITTALILLYEIVARYLFRSPTIWASELSTYAYGLSCVWAGSYAHLRRSHVGVEIITARFTKKANAIFDIFGALIFFLFLTVLLIYGGEQMWISIKRMELSQTALAIPLYPIKILTIIGLSLFFLQGLANVMRDIYFVFKERKII